LQAGVQKKSNFIRNNITFSYHAMFIYGICFQSMLKKKGNKTYICTTYKQSLLTHKKK